MKKYPANPKTSGEAIRKRRLDLGLRQIDVAKLIGCNELTIVNWENGYTTPRVNHTPRVAKFLGVQWQKHEKRMSLSSPNEKKIINRSSFVLDGRREAELLNCFVFT